MQLVRLSVLLTGRLHPRNYPMSVTGQVHSRAIVQSEGLRQMKNSNDIRNRSRDLLACSLCLCLSQLRHRVSHSLQVLRVTVAPEHTQRHTHSLGPLSTRDRPVAENATWQKTFNTDIDAPGGIRARNPNNPAAQTPDLERAVTGIGIWNNLFAEDCGRTNRHAWPLCVDFTHVLPCKTIKYGLPFFTSFDVCRYTRSDRQSLSKDFLQIAAMPSASLLLHCGSHPGPNVPCYIFPS